MRFRPFLLSALLLIAAAGPAAALEIAGRAEVLDSDILRVDGYRVFLLGVESVERGQLCVIDGRPWECWAAAVRALETIVAEGETVCQAASAPDVLNQVIARCRVNGEDIGARFVHAGYGLALVDETAVYAAEEATARAAAIGLWQGSFLSPAEWRRRNGIVAAERPAFVADWQEPGKGSNR